MTSQIRCLIRILIFFILVGSSVGWSSWSLLGVVRSWIFVLVLYLLESLGHLQELFQSKIWSRKYHTKIYPRLMHFLTLNASLALSSQLIVGFIPLMLLFGSLLILGLVALVVASPVLVSLVRLLAIVLLFLILLLVILWLVTLLILTLLLTLWPSLDFFCCDLLFLLKIQCQVEGFPQIPWGSVGRMYLLEWFPPWAIL